MGLFRHNPNPKVATVNERLDAAVANLDFLNHQLIVAAGHLDSATRTMSERDESENESHANG